VFASSNQKILAISNAVKAPLSSRRAEFEGEIHRIEGEVNKQGGGVALLSSGLAVYRFALEIEAELRNRSQIARETLGKAIDLQQLKLHQKTLEKVKESIREVWSEETADLRAWYQRRVLIHDEIAKERPFEESTESVFQGVLVDIENKALGPGFWGRNKDNIWLVIIGAIIGSVLTILTQGFLAYLLEISKTE